MAALIEAWGLFGRRKRLSLGRPIGRFVHFLDPFDRHRNSQPERKGQPIFFLFFGGFGFELSPFNDQS